MCKLLMLQPMYGIRDDERGFQLHDRTSVESCNKTLHIQAWNDPMEPMDKVPLLPD
jgi:hypothetical protein